MNGFVTPILIPRTLESYKYGNPCPTRLIHQVIFSGSFINNFYLRRPTKRSGTSIHRYSVLLFNLESVVGRVEGCVHGGAEQGSLLRLLRSRHLYILVHRATTRNSYSIPRSCNVTHRDVGNAGSVRNMNRPALRRCGRAIRLVA